MALKDEYSIITYDLLYINQAPAMISAMRTIPETAPATMDVVEVDPTAVTPTEDRNAPYYSIMERPYPI